MKNQNENELVELLSAQWHGDSKMIEYCLKSGKYIKVDNRYISVCQAKPTITKTLWYDDEQKSPGNGYNAFIEYNSHNTPHEFTLRSKGESLNIIPQYWDDQTAGKLCALTYFEGDKKQQVDVDSKTLDIINEALLEVQVDYKKRLDAYWKKYSDKVHAHGYWADR